MAEWSAKDYTPYFLFDEPVHTPKEIRKEYSRIRDIIVKRAKRLAKSGIPEFETLSQYLLKSVPKVKEIENEFQQAMRLAQAKKLLDEPTYSLAGIKKLQETIETETGVTIPLKDVLEFNEYMKSWRTGAYRWIVDTNTAVKLYYSEYQNYGGTFDNFYTLFMMEKRNRENNA